MRDRGFWPEDVEARAAARALAAEMHSGFAALRAEAAMNVRRGGRGVALSDAAQADLDRMSRLWGWARGRFGGAGPYLFGERLTVADVFFAPIVWRVLSYGLSMPEPDLAYLRALEAHPAMAEWAAAAWAEPRRLDRYESL
jgi:glutathione S-transferase